MKDSLLAGLGIAAVLGVVLVSTSSSATTGALAQTQATTLRLAADAACRIPGAGVVSGKIEVVTDADHALGRASFTDENGALWRTRGFGLSGESVVIVEGEWLQRHRIELGEAAPAGVSLDDLFECTFAAVSSETRPLTIEDEAAQGIDTAAVGRAAEIETSFSGVAWVEEQ